MPDTREPTGVGGVRTEQALQQARAQLDQPSGAGPARKAHSRRRLGSGPARPSCRARGQTSGKDIFLVCGVSRDPDTTRLSCGHRTRPVTIGHPPSAHPDRDTDEAPGRSRVHNTTPSRPRCMQRGNTRPAARRKRQWGAGWRSAALWAAGGGRRQALERLSPWAGAGAGAAHYRGGVCDRVSRACAARSNWSDVSSIASCISRRVVCTNWASQYGPRPWSASACRTGHTGHSTVRPQTLVSQRLSDRTYRSQYGPRPWSASACRTGHTGHSTAPDPGQPAPVGQDIQVTVRPQTLVSQRLSVRTYRSQYGPRPWSASACRSGHTGHSTAPDPGQPAPVGQDIQVTVRPQTLVSQRLSVRTYRSQYGPRPWSASACRSGHTGHSTAPDPGQPAPVGQDIQVTVRPQTLVSQRLSDRTYRSQYGPRPWVRKHILTTFYGKMSD